MARERNAVIETTEEEVLRNRLLRRLQRLFRDGGYPLYYEEFKNYKLDVDDDLSAPGSIDSQRKIIHIRRDVLEKASDDEISLLLRHELLHSLLQHIVRSVKFYARELGINPSSITKSDMRIIHKRLSTPLASWDIVSAPVAFNIAGDEHLSNYYDEIDKKVTRDPEGMLFGGLVVDDHPEWVGKSFESILRSLVAEENALQKRLAKKIYGRYVDEDTFEIESEEESEFDTATEIMEQDIVDVDMWDIPTFERDAKYNPEALAVISSNYSNCWLRFEEDESESYKAVPAASINGGQIIKVNPQFSFPIFPIIKVRYLSHYKYLQDNGSISCLGLTCIPLDRRRLIAVSPVIEARLSNIPYCKEFKGSIAEKEFTAWKKRFYK